MAIVQAVVRQLDGFFEAATDNAARFTLTVPLPKPARPASRSFAPPETDD